MQYLIAFCSQLETASDVISGRFVRSIVPNKSVKFCDALFKDSGEHPPIAVGGGILDGFFSR